MKVVFDHQIFSLQKNGGISRYVYKLYENLLLLGVDVAIRVSWTENVYIPNGKKLPQFFPWRMRQLLYYFLNQLNDYLHPVQNIDVCHATYYGSTPLQRRARVLSITIFDMIHEMKLIQPSLFDSTVKNKHAMLKRSDVIFSISQSTRNEIVQVYPDLNKDVQVTYLGCDFSSKVFSDEAETVILPEKYLLFVGNRAGYKNFIPYLTAIASKLVDEKLFVIAFGGGSFSQAELDSIAHLGLLGLVKQVSGDDMLLTHYYRQALFFVYPSLSEGFGLPIVEAFTLSCPVLTSNCSSMAEIAGDAALLMNPTSSTDMLQKTERLLSSNSLRKQMKENGLGRSKDFTWKKTAQQTLEAYRKIMT